MSLLSERVQKSKRLQFVKIPGTKNGMYGTYGSQFDHYQIELSHSIEEIQFGDKPKEIVVFEVNCQQTKANPGNNSMQTPCKGNCRHTVCYHSLGVLRQAFSENNKAISFYDNVFAVMNSSSLGGKIAKVQSPSGGSIWAIVREAKTKVKNSPIVNLMRGDEDDEGID